VKLVWFQISKALETCEVCSLLCLMSLFKSDLQEVMDVELVVLEPVGLDSVPEVHCV